MMLRIPSNSRRDAATPCARVSSYQRSIGARDGTRNDPGSPRPLGFGNQDWLSRCDLGNYSRRFAYLVLYCKMSELAELALDCRLTRDVRRTPTPAFVAPTSGPYLGTDAARSSAVEKYSSRPELKRRPLT